jgi:hypothetical protein
MNKLQQNSIIEEAADRISPGSREKLYVHSNDGRRIFHLGVETTANEGSMMIFEGSSGSNSTNESTI